MKNNIICHAKSSGGGGGGSGGMDPPILRGNISSISVSYRKTGLLEIAE